MINGTAADNTTGNPAKAYLDFHTHILPQMDDGSKSLEMSLEMLRLSAETGVRCVVLTPHFYANQDTLDHFLEKRARAAALLRSQWTQSYPIMLTGAEVYYFRDMSSIAELLKLRIQNTELLLLEMPFRKWTDTMISDVLQLNDRDGIRVVLAHADRYVSYQPKGTLEALAENGIQIQINADYFCEKATVQKALRMFENGMIHFLGSDCHDLKKRPQCLAKSIAVLEEKFGVQRIEQFVRDGMRRLVEANVRSIKNRAGES